MSPARAVILVAARELADRLRSKVYVIGTLAVVVMAAGLIVAPALLAEDGPGHYRLGVAGDVPADFEKAVGAVAAERGVTIDVVGLAGREEAAAAVADGDVDAALHGDRELLADGGAPAPALRASVQRALERLDQVAALEAAGLNQRQIDEVLSAARPVAVVDPSGTAGGGPDGELIALAATVVLFLAIQLNGNALMTGSIEEKSSRVVEVLLGSVRPWQLLAGKLAAMSTLALAQVGLLIGATLAANAWSGAFAVPPLGAETAVVSLAMVVTGFLFYAGLYVVAGSMVASVEDAQASSAPLAFAVIASYLLALFAVIPSPDGSLAQVLTFVPPTAPFTVPARMALGAIPTWQSAVAVAITLAGAVLAVRLAGRLYAAAVLAGGRITWRDAWRAEPIR